MRLITGTTHSTPDARTGPTANRSFAILPLWLYRENRNRMPCGIYIRIRNTAKYVGVAPSYPPRIY